MKRYSIEINDYSIEFETESIRSDNALIANLILTKLAEGIAKVSIIPLGTTKDTVGTKTKQNVIPDFSNSAIYCYELGEYIDLNDCSLESNPIVMLCTAYGKIIDSGFPSYNGYLDQYLGRWVGYHIGIINKTESKDLIKHGVEIEVYLI